MEFDVDVGEALRLVRVDDFLPTFFEFLFAQRPIDLEVDALAQRLRTNPLGTGNFNFMHERTRLEDDHHLDAVTLWLGENPDVLQRARGVERTNVLFGDRLGIRLAGLRANLRYDPLLGNRLRSDVLNLDGPDDRWPLLIRRILPVNRHTAQER